MSDSENVPSSDFFDVAYRETPPWDIGAGQPALLALFDEFPPVGPALDVGCGFGDTVFALAERGLTVMGVDFAAAAIDQARSAAQKLTLEARYRVAFTVADALHSSQLPEAPFASVVDSGFLHVLDQPTRDAFARDLSQALAIGGRYYVLGFAFDTPMPNMPKRVSENELRARFTFKRGWRVLAVRPATFVLHGMRTKVPAIIACIERVVQS